MNNQQKFEQFRKKFEIFESRHTEYDFSRADYKGSKKKLLVICRKHGEFWAAPEKLLLGKGCPVCGREASIRKRTLTKEDFVDRARKIHSGKYGYSKVSYINIKTPVIIICPKHGEFLFTPDNHLRGHGCAKCANEAKNLTREEFIAAATKKHGKLYDYSKVDYRNVKTKICIICRKHGEFWQYPAAHLRGKGCPVCSSSKGELRIASLLESKGYVLNESYFREQTFDGCKDRIALRYDFYIPSKNLLIEYNGIQHYYQTFDNHDLRIQRHHDWLKRKYAKKHGVRLLTIPFTEYENIDKVLAEAL